jgi:hypothetical protein
MTRAFRHGGFAVGAALTGLVALAALVSLAWTPGSPTAIAVGAKLQGPSAAHWLGTAQRGRDPRRRRRRVDRPLARRRPGPVRGGAARLGRRRGDALC